MPVKQKPEKAVKATFAVNQLAADHERAIELLEEFTERFYWVDDHHDYQAEVRDFLRKQGLSPRPYGH